MSGFSCSTAPIKRCYNFEDHHHIGEAIVELSHDEVRRIAELAKLHLTDAEVTLYAGQLAHVLEAFQALRQVDTAHIAPTASVLPLRNIWRDDRALPPLSPDEVIANAAHAVDHQFLVEDIFSDS
ncbi:MAG: Asp-tRNA(Asn)/Glu-tRNA(Gln) amidotransferase subunit GatC [Chloroflexota bacterium]|nr:Asp-tRNA(Asn)/Glu-tRNA(Gln) amidotransferase subunit GatC [Chloroflexota bacterium]